MSDLNEITRVRASLAFVKTYIGEIENGQSFTRDGRDSVLPITCVSQIHDSLKRDLDFFTGRLAGLVGELT